MSRHYKEIKNGNGTSLQINDDKYISVGKNGDDIMIGGDINGERVVFGFDTWESFLAAICPSKAQYYHSQYYNPDKPTDNAFKIYTEDVPVQMCAVNGMVIEVSRLLNVLNIFEKWNEPVSEADIDDKDAIKILIALQAIKITNASYFMTYREYKKADLFYNVKEQLIKA